MDKLSIYYRRVAQKGVSDDYPTDEWLARLFESYYDPCPLYAKENGKNGLDKADSWAYADYKGVFINPPYSNPKPWVEKAIRVHLEARRCIRRDIDKKDPKQSDRDWLHWGNECECWDCREWDSSADCIVMLLKHDTSTEWYRLLHEAGARFLLVNGRLRHGTGRSAAFPSVLAVLT